MRWSHYPLPEGPGIFHEGWLFPPSVLSPRTARDPCTEISLRLAAAPCQPHLLSSELISGDKSHFTSIVRRRTNPYHPSKPSIPGSSTRGSNKYLREPRPSYRGQQKSARRFEERSGAGICLLGGTSACC